VGCQPHVPATLNLGNRAGTYYTRDWVAPTVGLDGARNLAPTGFRSQDRPARSESLYRLDYSGLRIIIKSYYLFYLVKSL